MILFLQILGGLAAVALGFHLGRGRYTQSQQEIEARPRWWKTTTGQASFHVARLFQGE